MLAYPLPQTKAGYLPEPGLVSVARSLRTAGFGPVTDPANVDEVQDEAKAILRSDKLAAIDVHMQAR